MLLSICRGLQVDLPPDVVNKNLRANGAGLAVTLNLNGNTYMCDQLTSGGLANDDVSLTLSGPTPAPAAKFASARRSGASGPAARTRVERSRLSCECCRVVGMPSKAGFWCHSYTIVDGDERTELKVRRSKLETDLLTIGSHAGNQGALLLSDHAKVKTRQDTVLGVEAAGNVWLAGHGGGGGE